MRRYRWLCALAVGVAGCGGSTPTGSGGPVTQVTIVDYFFSPASVTIPAGSTVRWSNNGPSAHTSTEDAGAWNSGSMSPGSGVGNPYGGGTTPSSFARQFTTAGTFTYHCTIHPAMTGTIVVTP
jgi:plastocyanin